jgi:hypothetical protein
VGGGGKGCFRPTYQKGIFNLSWCHSINKESGGGEYEGGGEADGASSKDDRYGNGEGKQGEGGVA